MATDNFIPAAEAAFIAGIADKDLQRMVDDEVFPAALYERENAHRSFARVSAAFARFYVESAGHLTKQHRCDVIAQLTERLLQLEDWGDALALTTAISAMNWSVHFPLGSLSVEPIVRDAQARALRIARLATTITEDPEILGGVPVFRGTRVPIDAVVSSKAAGINFERLVASYPFLTPELLDDAEVYLVVHPRRGRPRKLASDTDTKGWKQVGSKVVRAGRTP